MTMSPERLKDQLCRTFCANIGVRAVPAGYAISTLFDDKSGDPISFYMVEDADGVRLEDDGEYLSNLIARDIAIDAGQRGQLLDSILADASAYWDRETYEIRTAAFSGDEVSERAIRFLSSLIRVRDLELLTREMVRSTFHSDVGAALVSRFGKIADISEDEPLSKEYSEFPVDFVLRPRDISGSVTGAVYLINSNDKLNEALLLHMELGSSGSREAVVIGLLEDPELRAISKRRFQRTQNRALPMPIFRGDEEAAMNLIARQMKVPARSNRVET